MFAQSSNNNGCTISVQPTVNTDTVGGKENMKDTAAVNRG